MSGYQRATEATYQPVGGAHSASFNDDKTSSRSRCRMIFTLLLVAAVVTLAVLLGIEMHKQKGPAPSPSPAHSSCSRQPVTSSQAMVSTTHYHATNAALEILQLGGNAADAAAAIQFMLAVVQPQSTGIGGGCFVLYRNASGHVFALDGREEAPARFNSTSFCNNPDCKVNASCDCSSGSWNFTDQETGGHPVGVPGVISAMARLRDDHGTMGFHQTMAPAIARAREGFAMYDELYSRIMLNKARLSLFEASRALYLPDNGMPVPVGELMKNPDLASTLELIATQGEQVFYQGTLAQDILNAVHNATNPVTGLNGVMQASDLANYSAVYREVVQSTYKNYTVFGFPPPSGGGLSLALMLHMLEPMKIPEMKFMGTEYIHRLLDVQNVAFADRNTWLADADFFPVPFEGFLNETYAKMRANEFIRPLDSAQAAYSASQNYTTNLVPPGDLLPTQPGISIASDRHGTTHLVVLDKHGNLVSMTTTIEDNMGSAVVVPGRGMLLNNELTDFTPLPADPVTKVPYANAPSGERRKRSTALGADKDTVGGKRPLSSMTPTVLLGDDGELIGIGSPGGSRIIGTVLNGILPIVDYKTCLADAVNAPRGIGRNRATGTELELDFVKSYPGVYSDLLERDFLLLPLLDNAPLGFLEAVRFSPGRAIEGAADHRNSVGSAKGI